MTKITKSTFKSLLRKNEGKLFIKCKSSFDGMTDSVETSRNQAYRPLVKVERDPARPFVSESDNTLGYGIGSGIWLVGDGGDRFKAISEAGFEGYEVYNCCGCFIVAVKAEQTAEAA